MYTVILSPIAEGKLRQLDRLARDRIIAKLEEVAKDPDRYISRLSAVDAFKFRVGDYRVILDLDRGELRLNVLTHGHRKSVYR